MQYTFILHSLAWNGFEVEGEGPLAYWTTSLWSWHWSLLCDDSNRDYFSDPQTWDLPKVTAQFLVGHKTDRLIPNKEDVLSLKETERSTTCMFTHECKDMLWSTSKGTLRKMQYHQNGPHLMNTSSNKLLNKKPPFLKLTSKMYLDLWKTKLSHSWAGKCALLLAKARWRGMQSHQGWSQWHAQQMLQKAPTPKDEKRILSGWKSGFYLFTVS